MFDHIPGDYPIPWELGKVLNKGLKHSDKDSALTQKYIEILKVLKNGKCLDIIEKQYLKLLRLALHLEEYQCNEDIKKHEMYNKTIEHVKKVQKDSVPELPDPKSNLFRITVDGLDEERPWIRANDYVDVINARRVQEVYTLRVRSVIKTDIVAHDESERLRKVHTDSTRYNIKFRFQNYPLRCAHHALSSMSGRGTVTYLFPHPRKSYFNKETGDYSDFEFVNSNIAGNVEQKQAILNIVNKSSFPAPYILYGPPGTGKTATLVEAICQLHNRDDNSHVLVCTPSNTAGDEIARRLLKFLPRKSIYRMYSQSMNISKIDEQLELCSNVDEKEIILPTRADIQEKRIVITTLCNAIRLIIESVHYSHFSHLFIDEAGQGTEPDILIPISLVSAGGDLYSQIVFAGDPQQLGPTVLSKFAESILGRSILERLMCYKIYRKDRNNKYNPKYITKLLNNYRSHPAIIHVSNTLFYENELIAKCPRSNGKNEKFPIIFHGVASKEEKYANSSSVYNPKEVDIVIEYVENLLNDRMGFGAVTADEIGVVTPFALQSKVIKKALKARNLHGINVGTVELFQGQERKVMIFSTVRNRTFGHKRNGEHIGFLSNFKRFNVAITRAKQLLIVVGNPMALQIDRNWRYLLKFCVDNRVYKGMPFHWMIYGQHPNFIPPHHVKSAAMPKRQPMPFHPCDKKLIDLMNNLNIDL